MQICLVGYIDNTPENREMFETYELKNDFWAERIKFRRRDGKQVDVSIKQKGESVWIAVRDHGRGIPEAELPHVKEKFYKGSSKNRGTGIGLAVCDEIVTRHGGELRVENAEGGGCRVTVILPVENK